MSTPTTLGGRIHRSWLYGTHLCMVDSFRPCAKRATWRHRNGHFYELDFFCASQSIRKEFQNVTTFSLGISDHWGKEVVLHFSDPCKGKTRQDRKARFLHVSRMKQIHQQQQKLQVEEMRGPSDEAGRKRRLFRTTVEDALENQGIPSSVPLMRLLVFRRVILRQSLYRWLVWGPGIHHCWVGSLCVSSGWNRTILCPCVDFGH